MNINRLATGLVNLFTTLVEGFLGFRFLLKLFGANSANSFVGWIYDMSAALLEPFRGIFPTQVFDNKYVLEFSTLFAMLVYAIVAVLLIAAIEAVASGARSSKKK